MGMLKSQRMMAGLGMEETVHPFFSEKRERVTVGMRMGQRQKIWVSCGIVLIWTWYW